VAKSIVLKTAVPGPVSLELTARKERVITDAKSLWMPFFIARGTGRC
jgi:hypothetical protein